MFFNMIFVKLVNYDLLKAANRRSSQQKESRSTVAERLS